MRLFLVGLRDDEPSSDAPWLLERAGHTVHRASSGVGGWEADVRRDLPVLLGCDAVATVSGWETRAGLLETYVAVALNMRVRPLEWWLERPHGHGS